MSDSILEAAIDDVGRNRVFEFMRAIGWSAGSDPPKWAWQSAVALLRQEVPQVSDSDRRLANRETMRKLMIEFNQYQRGARIEHDPADPAKYVK